MSPLCSRGFGAGEGVSKAVLEKIELLFLDLCGSGPKHEPRSGESEIQ